jgi:hypothetical protein
MLSEVAAMTGAECFRVGDALLDGGGFQYFSDTGNEIVTWYKDASHLSPDGSKLVADYLYRRNLIGSLAKSKSGFPPTPK